MKPSVLAIDPGPTQSGWVYVIEETGAICSAQLLTSEQVRKSLLFQQEQEALPDILAIEMIQHYGSGMPAGKDVFQTCIEIGRFIQCFPEDRPLVLVPRRDVKLHLCQDSRAKDPNIRQALIDRFPASGKDSKGNPSSIGTKKHPGPLYGIKSHLWAALGVAVTVQDNAEKYLNQADNDN